MRYHIGTTSRLGNRQTNQDRFNIIEAKSAVLLVMADGMGGHAGGQLAAEVIVETCSKHFNFSSLPVQDPQVYLLDLVFKCQQAVVEAGFDQSPPIEPKSTLVLCLIQGDEATWAHVGDSRLYVIRDKTVVEQTVDHSAVEELYQQGAITAVEKRTHPYRNKITQCIGSRLSPPSPTVSQTTDLTTDDLILLCSDGFWGQMKIENLKQGFTCADINQCLNTLAHHAEANGYPKSDNISAVALRWISNAPANTDSFTDHETHDLLDGLEEMSAAVKELGKSA